MEVLRCLITLVMIQLPLLLFYLLFDEAVLIFCSRENRAPPAASPTSRKFSFSVAAAVISGFDKHLCLSVVEATQLLEEARAILE